MAEVPLDLRWFANEDFRFRLGTVPGSAEAFFRRSPESAKILAERHHWLSTDARRYAALLPGGNEIADEFLSVAATWNELADSRDKLIDVTVEPFQRLRLASELLEPDLVLLAPQHADPGTTMTGSQSEPGKSTEAMQGVVPEFRVIGGCVCFPSGWRLTDKLGLRLSEVHETVPGLNASLRVPIDRLMAQLRPGKCVIRANWGVSSLSELNQHLDRFIPSIAPPLTLDSAWLRREDQLLFTLPRTRAVVFGIRVDPISWRALRSEPAAARSVARTLRTMPPEMLAYKRLTGLAEELARLLDDA